jgi:hypothetical protein
MEGGGKSCYWYAEERKIGKSHVKSDLSDLGLEDADGGADRSRSRSTAGVKETMELIIESDAGGKRRWGLLRSHPGVADSDYTNSTK